MECAHITVIFEYYEHSYMNIPYFNIDILILIFHNLILIFVLPLFFEMISMLAYVVICWFYLHLHHISMMM